MMYLKNLAATALLACSASAILLPPSVTSADLDNGDDFAMEIMVNPLRRTVVLDCLQCASAAKKGDDLIWQEGSGNSLLLDFEVGAKEDSLEIDGVQLYPPTFAYFSTPFSVTQLDPTSQTPLKLRVTGYTFHYVSAETISESGMELLPVTFKITSIEGKKVNPPTLTINLLKDANGRLMIASFQTAQASEKPAMHDSKECKEWPLLCKWKSIVADRIHGLKSGMRKGCHKHQPNPMAEDGPEGKPPHRFRPGHAHPHHRPGHEDGHRHHGPHGHHGHHRAHMMLRRIMFTVFIPIFVGLLVGTLTYVLGMFLGCLIAIVVAKVRGRPAYDPVALVDDDENEIEVNEKELYIEELAFDAPPQYEVSAEKEVVDESS